ERWGGDRGGRRRAEAGGRTGRWRARRRAHEAAAAAAMLRRRRGKRKREKDRGLISVKSEDFFAKWPGFARSEPCASDPTAGKKRTTWPHWLAFFCCGNRI